MNIFEIEKGYFRVYDGKTAYKLHVDEHRDFGQLPEPEAIYRSCKQAGCDSGETIDLMLCALHKRRIFKGDWLGDLSLCIALIGPRGSGKSVGMTGIAVLDGLLDLRRVVSNLPIAVEVRYKDCSKVFRTESLDATMMLNANEFSANYYNCLILVDEVNSFMADAQRTMSNQALSFSDILQQMRHRRLDFIFTCQAEGWQTNRMRFQVDFYIQCRDAAMFHGRPKKEDIGRKSQWRLHDMSGLRTGEVLHQDARTWVVPPFDNKTFWNTPFWNCFDTEQMQKREKFIVGPGNGQKPIGIDADRLKALHNTYGVSMDLMSKLLNLGQHRIQKSTLWGILGISGDAGMQTKVGKAMIDLGCTTISGSYGREYALPSKSIMVKNLAKMGLKINTEEEQDNGTT